MKIIGLFILMFGLVSIVAMAQTRSKPIVFTHATVIDATGADAQSDMVVIVTGETITEIGKFGKIEFPKNSQVIDATGKFLIPGLWDMHVHLTKAGENTLPLFIANGVTSVRLMPGADVAVLLIYPGYSLHDELQLLVKYVGLTPMEAIISATRYPAEFFGMQNRLGTIEKGKIADLVLLDANPLDDISNTKRIAAVVLNGKYLTKELREKMLADVEATANRGAGVADKPGKGRKHGSAN